MIVIRLSAESSPVAAHHDSDVPPLRDNFDQLFSTAMNQRAAAGQNLVRDFREQVEGMGGYWAEFNAIDQDALLGGRSRPSLRSPRSPTVDRTKRADQQSSLDIAAAIVDEDSTGITVRGAKTLGTSVVVVCDFDRKEKYA